MEPRWLGLGLLVRVRFLRFIRVWAWSRVVRFMADRVLVRVGF